MMLNSRLELADYFKELNFKKGAEIGVANGYYSEVLCRAIPDLTLYCIDPWNPYKGNRRGGSALRHHTNYDLAKDKLKKYNVMLVRKKSVEASLAFKDKELDFVFIDGNHDFDYVMEDIITWNRKVRPGGIISGHDYYEFRSSGIIEAVDYYTKIHKLDLNIIPAYPEGSRDDRVPCFWWRKP